MYIDNPVYRYACMYNKYSMSSGVSIYGGAWVAEWSRLPVQINVAYHMYSVSSRLTLFQTKNGLSLTRIARDNHCHFPAQGQWFSVYSGFLHQ